MIIQIEDESIRSVARKETLDVHQKNWVCHIYCQINAKKNKKNMLIGYYYVSLTISFLVSVNLFCVCICVSKLNDY